MKEEKDPLEPEVKHYYVEEGYESNDLIHVCKIIGKNWVLIGFHLEPRGLHEQLHIRMDLYSETHDIQVDPELSQQAIIPCGVRPEEALRYRLAKHGFTHTPSGEEDLYQPPPTLHNYGSVIGFLEKHLSELTGEPIEFASPPRDEKAIRKQRERRAEVKESNERFNRLGKMRWAPIEARCEQAMLKASSKSQLGLVSNQYATFIRDAILEHYREKSELKWALLRKMSDKSLLEKRIEDFTKDNVPIDDPDDLTHPNGLRNSNPRKIWISQKAQLEMLIKEVISKKSISQYDEKRLKNLINTKQMLGL